MARKFKIAPRKKKGKKEEAILQSINIPNTLFWEQTQVGSHHRAFVILFISADLLGSGSSIALSVSTCLIRHIDFLTLIFIQHQIPKCQLVIVVPKRWRRVKTDATNLRPKCLANQLKQWDIPNAVILILVTDST